MKGIYVASRASLPTRAAMWRALRLEGHPIISSWIDEDGAGETDCFTELWTRITREIAGCDYLVFYAEPEDFPLKGALVEVGLAIGMGKPVIVCLPGVEVEGLTSRPVGSWIGHPSVTRTDNLREAMDYSLVRIVDESGLVLAARALNRLCDIIHDRNVKAGWWTDVRTGESLLGQDEFGRDRRNVPEMLCLIHSEVSEAMEGYRKKLPDDKLPHRSMFEVELADVLIRVFDLAGGHKLDLAGAVLEKLAYNQTREDHQLETRVRGEGKQF